MKTLLPFFIALMSIVISTDSFSQAGSLDLTFGNDGIVVSPVTAHREFAYDCAVQADGKVVLGGFREVSGSSDMMATRYNADGTPDLTFGTDGVALVDFGTNSDQAWCMALQGDGKILLGGYVSYQVTTVDDYALARLNTDGSLDNTFGNGGMVTTDIDGEFDDAFAIAVQDDGKIILAGDGYSDGRRHCCLVRYNEDGSLDNTFGNGGIVLKTIGWVEDRTRAISLQSDGKIVVSGYCNSGDVDVTFVTRFNSDGTSDNSFGNEGVATLSVGTEGCRFLCMCIQPDDKTIIAGFMSKSDQTSDALFVRYNTDGSLDDTFGNATGIYLHAFNSADIIEGIVLQPDGKILSCSGTSVFELARLMPDGSRDYDFGTDGVVNTYTGNSSNTSSICLYGTNKVVLAGRSKEGGEYNFAAVRYHLEGEGGIADVEHNSVKLTVNPNPALDKVIISYELLSDQKISIDLISLEGKKVVVFINELKRYEGTYKETFNLSPDIPPGIYLIRLFSEKGQSLQKLVVQ